VRPLASFDFGPVGLHSNMSAFTLWLVHCAQRTASPYDNRNSFGFGDLDRSLLRNKGFRHPVVDQLIDFLPSSPCQHPNAHGNTHGKRQKASEIDGPWGSAHTSSLSLT
jgi:hypothetical protein